MSDRKFARVVSLFIIIFTLFNLSSPAVLAETNTLPSMENVESACVINVESRKVLIDKNINNNTFPASTVKLMTALVAYEHFKENLETKITVTKEMLSATSGRYLGFLLGEEIRVIDLLHAMLMGGYNDAAVILAFATAGDIQTFCEKMNEKARELGATATYYTNPTGLHDKAMMTTAYDTALIGMAIFEDPTLLTMTKTIKYTLPKTNKSDEHTIYNHNPLITTSMTEEYYYSYAQGMNVGATNEGGDCVVTGGELDGLSFVCVVLGGHPTVEDDKTNYACIAAKNLLRYALVSYEIKTLFSDDEIVGSIPIRFSATEEKVNVKPLRELTALLHIGVDPQKDIQFNVEISPQSLDAPVFEGQVVGSIQAIYDNTVLDSTELILTETMESHGFLVFMYKTKLVTQHPAFIISLSLIAVGIVVLLIRRSPKIRKKDKRKRNRYFDSDEFQ